MNYSKEQRNRLVAWNLVSKLSFFYCGSKILHPVTEYFRRIRSRIAALLIGFEEVVNGLLFF